MTLLANYEPNFYAKYSISNKKADIPALVHTETARMTFKYVD